MPTSACIVLRVTCDVDLTFAALNAVHTLEKFVLKYNELVEDKHKHSPAIQAMPLAVLEAVFDNSVTADILNRFGIDIRLCINVLDQALDSLRPVKPLYNRIFNKLQSLCRLHSYLPASLRLRSTKVKRKDTAHVNHGGHGYLYKGECQGRDVALKQIATDKISDMSQALKRFCKEAIVWKYLDHRNIATLLGVNVSLFPGNVCMVSPWMENGDISAYLCKNQGANRLHLLLNVAEGLMYLHSVFQVVHADIKGANVLVDDEGHALLTDFGLATIADDHDDAVDTRVTEADDRGTVRWIAPELLDSENGRTPLPTKKSDVYSLSMLMWEVFAGRVPWPELAKGAQIVYAVLKGARPLRLPHIQLLSDYLMLFGR
ncbi:hypothetical protein AcW1_010020 [Taiwanofungus camphoratus]|nr:hypothetical protein AcW1_010020 [Antrodia cinnamomea]